VEKMSILSEHSLGFCNLWLLMVVYALPIILTVIFRKRIFQSTSSRFSSSRKSREYNLFIGSKILMLIYFLYAILIPVHINTIAAIFGLVIYSVGFAFYSASWITIAKTEKGKVFSQGPFRLSRHPVYVSSGILFAGAGLVSQSWVYLGLSLLVGISHMSNALVEEKICLETFGDQYRQYMDGTPRWFGWPTRKPNSTNSQP
jgi:protein-S-isoprenylcysteine O-methyltransferase Ste14